MPREKYRVVADYLSEYLYFSENSKGDNSLLASLNRPHEIAYHTEFGEFVVMRKALNSPPFTSRKAADRYMQHIREIVARALSERGLSLSSQPADGRRHAFSVYVEISTPAGFVRALGTPAPVP